MNEPVRRKRPLLITLICLLGGGAVLVAAAQVATRWGLMLRESLAGSIAAVAGLIISAACLYGLWRMKRWAVLVFALALGARILYGLFGGPPLSVDRLVGPGLILGVGLVYWKRMG